MRRIVSLDTILIRMSTRYSFLIAAGSLAIFGLVTLTVLMGFQSPVPITPTPSRSALILLYDTIPSANAIERSKALNAKPFYILYESCDPQAAESGVINIENCLRAIESETGGKPPEWGMLDFENPFTSDLQKGPDAHEYRRAIQTMVALIRAVKLRYPNTKWTYYGVPYLPFWIMENKQTWSSATTEVKRSELNRGIAIFAPLIEELDWISPSIYACYDLKLFRKSQWDFMAKGDSAWRQAQIGLGVILGKGKPVIPTVAPYWGPAGLAEYCRVIPTDTFLNGQLAPSLAEGASGFAVWTGIGYYIKIATAGPEQIFPNEKNYGQNEWRAAFTKDYFDNQTPTDWTRPEIKRRLEAATSDTIVGSLQSIRNWESSIDNSKK